MKPSSLLLRLVSLLSFAGCALDEPSQNDEQLLLDDQVFYQTIVTAMPDGSVQVGEPIAITVAQERAQNEARLAAEAGTSGVAPIVLDPGCGGASFWLYARTDLYGDRVCFIGGGDFNLDTLARYITINGKKYWAGSWAIASGSFWAGVAPGRLFNNAESGPAVGYFWSTDFDAYAQVVFEHRSRAHDIALYQ